jgi:hypothetical protein
MIGPMVQLTQAFKRWRQKNREYAIQRAIYKAGGGGGPPSVQARSARSGPTAATHMPDPKDASGDNPD